MQMRLTYWTAFWVFLIDQATKYLVVHRMNLSSLGQIDVAPPWITFKMAWNEGVNFGILSGLDMRWLLIALALAISGMVLHWLRRDGGGRAMQISGGLLIGGALGNVVDRVLYGAVADFLNMSCCGIDNPYAFNVADIAIFVGAVGLVVFTKDDGGKQKPARRKPR